MSSSSKTLSSFGSVIRDARHERGFTQDELAKRLGFTRQAVSNWECDVKIPGPGDWLSICEVLDISANALSVAADNRVAKPTVTFTYDFTDISFDAFDRLFLRGADLDDCDEMRRRREHLGTAFTMALAFSEVPGRIVLGINVDNGIADLVRALREMSPKLYDLITRDPYALVEFFVKDRLTQADLDADPRLQRQLDLLFIMDVIFDLASRDVTDPLRLLEYIVDREWGPDFSVLMPMSRYCDTPRTIVFSGLPQCNVDTIPGIGVPAA